MTEKVHASRALRRDAVQSRERILNAARQVFARHGLEASVEEVTGLAGVGMGTLYRRFATKEALIDELVAELLRELIAVARDALDRRDGTGLETFLRAAAVKYTVYLGCLPRLWKSDVDPDMRDEILVLIDELLADAQDHQQVRNDVTATDIRLVLWSVRGVIEATQAIVPDAWQRHLDIVFAGLAPSPQRLTHPPLSPREARLISDNS
jgi:AcrR family transcriptional regulator